MTAKNDMNKKISTIMKTDVYTVCTTHMCTHTLAYLRDTMGSIPGHCNKANIVGKPVT